MGSVLLYTPYTLIPLLSGPGHCSPELTQRRQLPKPEPAVFSHTKFTRGAGFAPFPSVLAQPSYTKMREGNLRFCT